VCVGQDVDLATNTPVLPATTSFVFYDSAVHGGVPQTQCTLLTYACQFVLPCCDMISEFSAWLLQYLCKGVLYHLKILNEN
jgi:hypothetical protein